MLEYCQKGEKGNNKQKAHTCSCILSTLFIHAAHIHTSIQYIHTSIHPYVPTSLHRYIHPSIQTDRQTCIHTVCHVMLCYVMSCCVLLCHVMLRSELTQPTTVVEHYICYKRRAETDWHLLTAHYMNLYIFMVWMYGCKWGSGVDAGYLHAF